MATRALIGFSNENTSPADWVKEKRVLRGTNFYMHYDGYPEYVIPIIESNLEDLLSIVKSGNDYVRYMEMNLDEGTFYVEFFPENGKIEDGLEASDVQYIYEINIDDNGCVKVNIFKDTYEEGIIHWAFEEICK